MAEASKATDPETEEAMRGLAFVMKEQRWDTVVLGEVLGVSAQALSQWRRGLTKPTGLPALTLRAAYRARTVFALWSRFATARKLIRENRGKQPERLADGDAATRVWLCRELMDLEPKARAGERRTNPGSAPAGGERRKGERRKAKPKASGKGRGKAASRSGQRPKASGSRKAGRSGPGGSRKPSAKG